MRNEEGKAKCGCRYSYALHVVRCLFGKTQVSPDECWRKENGSWLRVTTG